MNIILQTTNAIFKAKSTDKWVSCSNMTWKWNNLTILLDLRKQIEYTLIRQLPRELPDLGITYSQQAVNT